MANSLLKFLLVFIHL